jgi:hypothetical protein
MANSNRKLGGGSGSHVVREVGNRVGARAKIVNPRAVSQIGQQLSNHAPESSNKIGGAAETMYGAKSAAGKPGGVLRGNECALNVKGGGPGTGREVMRSGSQCVTGPVAGKAPAQGRDILSQYGPDSMNVRGRR